MAKKYYSPHTKTWQSWRFLKARQQQPQYREAYLAALKKRKRGRRLKIILGIPLLALGIFGGLVAIGTLGEDPDPGEPTTIPFSSSTTESSSESVARYSAPASSTVTEDITPVTPPATTDYTTYSAPQQSQVQTPPASSAPSYSEAPAASESASQPPVASQSEEPTQTVPSSTTPPATSSPAEVQSPSGAAAPANE